MATTLARASLAQPYGAVARALHWVVAALVLAQLATKLVFAPLLPQSAQGEVNAWHLSIGATILLLMVLRLIWRLTHPPPPPPADLPRGLQLLSRATHWGFYAVLVVLPVLGWVAANAYGATVRLFGVVPLPTLAAKDMAFAEQVGNVHGGVALLLLLLIALHVAGAAYHAFVKRDGVVRRMTGGPAGAA